MRAEAVPHELEHLKQQAHHDGVLTSQRAHEHTEHHLGADGEDADHRDEHRHHDLTESHHLQATNTHLSLQVQQTPPASSRRSPHIYTNLR